MAWSHDRNSVGGVFSGRFALSRLCGILLFPPGGYRAFISAPRFIASCTLFSSCCSRPTVAASQATRALRGRPDSWAGFSLAKTIRAATTNRRAASVFPAFPTLPLPSLLPPLARDRPFPWRTYPRRCRRTEPAERLLYRRMQRRRLEDE